MSDHIILRDFTAGTLSTSEQYKARLIEAGKLVTQVTTNEEQNTALAAYRDLKALRTETETTRKAIKAPVIALGKRIDDTAETFIAPAEREEKRLEGLINHFQILENRKRQDAEAAAEKERQRIESERLEAERLAAESERLRIEAERKAKEAEQMKGGKQKAAAEAEAERIEADSIRLREEAMAKELEADDAPQPIAIPIEQPKGVGAKTQKNFRLIGKTVPERRANLGKLFAAHPELFNFTGKDETPRGYSVSLKILDLMERLNGKLAPAIDSAPGIEIFDDFKVSIR